MSIEGESGVCQLCGAGVKFVLVAVGQNDDKFANPFAKPVKL